MSRVGGRFLDADTSWYILSTAILVRPGARSFSRRVLDLNPLGFLENTPAPAPLRCEPA